MKTSQLWQRFMFGLHESSKMITTMTTNASNTKNHK